MDHAIQTLPVGYKVIRQVDLSTNKTDARNVTLLSVLLLLVPGLILNAIMPVSVLYDITDFRAYVIRWVILLVGLIVYVILHELTHALAMKLQGGTDFRFGFKGLYAYAGSEKDYFDRSAYMRIALAPLVVWFFIFLLLSFLVSGPAKWVIFFWQLANISGAAGDIYVTYLTYRAPKDTRIRDTGVSMAFYSKEDPAHA